MSKRSERKARRQEQIRRNIRNAGFVTLIGLVFLALGCVGLIQNGRQLRAYEHSESVVAIPAEIIYAEPKTMRNEYDSPYTVYDVQLKYTIDGMDYRGKARLYDPVQKGDTRQIEVYKTPNGEYRIPEIETRDNLLAKNLIPMIGIVIGALFSFIGIFMVISGKRELKGGKQA